MQKQIREMRDLWWEVCAERKKLPAFVAFNQRLDQIQSGIAFTHAAQADQAATLGELKSAFSILSGSLAKSVSAADSLTQFTAATGIALPPTLIHGGGGGGSENENVS